MHSDLALAKRICDLRYQRQMLNFASRTMLSGWPAPASFRLPLSYMRFVLLEIYVPSISSKTSSTFPPTPKFNLEMPDTARPVVL